MSIDRPALPKEVTETGVVAIVRAASTARVGAAVDTLVECGITCVELTLTMPQAVACIFELVKRLGDSACIGAGTVLTRDQARECIGAGAQFLVAPSVVPDVVETAVSAGIPCLPGALTPSEIVAAWNTGASAVKLFPASLGGARYLRDVRAPLPDIPLIPTGGVGIDDVPGYLAAGAVAVGLGSPLFGESLRDGDLADLAERAKKLVAAVRVAREGRPV